MITKNSKNKTKERKISQKLIILYFFVTENSKHCKNAFKLTKKIYSKLSNCTENDIKRRIPQGCRQNIFV